MLSVFAIRTGMAYVGLAAFICLILAAELAFPREAVMPWRHRARVILFMLIGIPASYLCGHLTTAIIHPPRLTALPLLIGAPLAVVGADFIYYWFHRAQHAVPALWRVHAVHHSIEKMGAGSGFHHWLEAPLRGLFVSIPAAALFGGQGAILGFLVTLHGYYVHSTTRINFGRFSAWLCDNRVHRIHHSRAPEHFNCNFGVVTLLWDRLFGTAALPALGEWPAVGLDERREPRSVREWLALRSSQFGRPTSTTALESRLRQPLDQTASPHSPTPSPQYRRQSSI